MTTTSYAVSVVEFLMPDGRTRNVTTELPIETESLYRDMVAAGCRFEAEMLQTGKVSVTITKEGEDVDIEITMDCSSIQKAMAAMLKRELWK